MPGYMHYRLDRICNARVTEEKCTIPYEQVDAYEYSGNKLFIFVGKMIRATIRCKKRILDAMIDIFGRDIKLTDLDDDHYQFSVTVSESGIVFLAHDEVLANMIEEIFYETYKGYRFVRDEIIRRYGVIYNDKTVYKYMKILGLSSPIRKKRYQCCTNQDPNEKTRIVCNNFLARNFTASRPLEKLVTDVSYIYSQEGRMYLSVIKDLFDNSIIAYQISKFNDLKIVMDNLIKAVGDNWDPTHFCVLHSDQGFQYTNELYIRYLDDHGITVSHSRKA
ncbi:MAG: DDE-type integrase/transposase/recombinase, partial [Solobacterium sp.]|nr:DDE-type integrase/transposase/recombinase [Solobacterium sp.]